MKKQIRQISKIAAFVLLGIFCVTSALSQTEPPNANKSDVWIVHYAVSVKGDFKNEGEPGSGSPTVFYHLNRQYRGKSKMVFFPRPDDPQATLKYPTFKDSATEVSIEINDFWNTHYEPICDEYKTIEETWKADVSSFFGDKKSPHPALLLINNEKRSYKTSFPILYTEKPNQYDIKYDKKEIEHSKDGKKKEKAFPTKYLAFATHEYPTVKGFIEKYSIIRSPDWSELKWEESIKGYSWTSEVLHPDEPLIEGVPESKAGVDILITYTFYKVNG